MSLDKSEVRIGVATEIGVALDDALEAAHGETKFFEGGNSALVQAARQVQGLARLVDDDVDGKSGTNEIPDLATASLLKKYITRAVAILESGAKAADNSRLIAEGKKRALEAAVSGVKKRVDTEKLRMEQARVMAEAILKEAQEAKGTERAAGTHPGSSVKARRQAEEIAAEAAGPSSRKRGKKRRGANT